MRPLLDASALLDDFEPTPASNSRFPTASKHWRARLRSMQNGHLARARKAGRLHFNDRGETCTVSTSAPARGIPSDEVDILPATNAGP